TGPGVTAAPWSLSVPLTGMFNGRHTMPLAVLLEKEIVAPVQGFEQANLHVRVTAAGEDVSGNLVFPSLGAGLKATGGPYTQVSGAETKEFQIAVEGTGGHNHTPLNGTVALEFSRKGEVVKQRTPPTDFRVTFVPQFFGWNLAQKTCNGISLSSAVLTIYASG